MSQIQDIQDILQELLEDNTVPKNVRTKIEEIIDTLNQENELSLRINKSLNLLDDISDDNNLQSYTRTQIWNITSMLESLD